MIHTNVYSLGRYVVRSLKKTFKLYGLLLIQINNDLKSI